MEKIITKPTFKGRLLIEIPETIPLIGFLEGDFGKTFLKEYRGRVKSDYDGNLNLDVLRYWNIVKGSNPFAVVLANQILKEENLRVATQADLEKALRIGWTLKETYEDTGLVLRSEEDEDFPKNTLLAKDLAEQLKAKGRKFSFKTPVMIPLTEFELEKADNSYGLTFKLREDAEIYESPILSKEKKFDSKDIDKKTGLPKKVSSSGNRTLYVRYSGLSKLNLYSDMNLNSGNGYLDCWSNSGRVVAISSEATTSEKIKSELLDKINEEYQIQLDDLNSRKAEIEKVIIEIMRRKR